MKTRLELKLQSAKVSDLRSIKIKDLRLSMERTLGQGEGRRWQCVIDDPMKEGSEQVATPIHTSKASWGLNIKAPS